MLQSGFSGMITGGAAATVFYNLRLRHPTLDLPIIDYDLALLVQPMLMLGISIGVSFNVIFANWMITVLLMIFFIGKNYMKFLVSSGTTCLSMVTTCRHID